MLLPMTDVAPVRKTLVFFRNDDVDKLEPGLVETTDLLLRLGAPVSHAVMPASLEDPARDWLLERRADGVEIIQHGFAHIKHDRGEFGGNRPAEAQLQDLRQGLEIMQGAFGDSFFRAMSFPYGSYNEHTMGLLDRLGFPVVSCHWRHQFSRQVYYRLGRILRRGRLFDHHVSHHLGLVPGTNVREISVSISPIVRYFPDQGPLACEYAAPAALRAAFDRCRRLSPVVGVVLHHRYHADAASLALLDEFATWIKDQPGIEFTDLKGIETGLAGGSRRLSQG